MSQSLCTNTSHTTCFGFLKYCGLLLLLASGSQVEACPVANKLIKVTAKSHVLTAEVATNREGHVCGLAFRRDLPADHGMLFVYERDLILSFWMKNTFVPLSIAFLDSDGGILEIQKMDPRNPARRYTSKSPARYALEVNQGWFADHDIAVGSRIEFDLYNDQEIYRFNLD